MATDPVLTAPAIRLYLALLLSPRPVSMAECGAWDLAEFGEQLKLLYQATERGWVSEAAEGPSGRLSWTDSGAAEQLIEQASAEDWQAVLDGAGFRQSGPKAAREAAQRGDGSRARLLYRALVVGLRAALQGRAAGESWLAVVMEALRLFRREVTWLSSALQQEAFSQAVQLDDRGAQGVLLATGAYEELRGGRSGEAESQCERALELAAGLDDVETRQHILLYVANNWILLGRLPEALSMLESFLGDIPPDLLPAPHGAAARDTLTEASLATLANVYAWTGNDERALDLLERMVDVGTRTAQPLLAKMAKVYLAWFHADRGNLEQAERFSQAAQALLEPEDVYRWFVSQPAAWVSMQQDDPEQARTQLDAGHRSRLRVGHTHFQNSYLLDVLAWLERSEVERIDGLTLEGELSRLLASPDQRMRGVAARFRARQLAQREADRSGPNEVDELLEQSIELLRSAGAMPELLRTLQDAAGFAEQQGRSDEVERRRAELGELEQLRSPERHAPGSGDARESHVARAIVDMGRLTLLSHRREGFFGDVAARICRELAVERCALFETTDEVRLLAARGADRRWVAALQELLQAKRPLQVQFIAPPQLTADDDDEQYDEARKRGPGQLVLIPYRLDDLARRGWVCLGNHSRPALIGPDDQALLESLGVQMSVLIGNVELWQELSNVRQRLERENRYYRQESPTPTGAGPLVMVGQSPAFRRMFDLIARVAPTQSATLILGETGVGKELVAREIHRLSGSRQGPFIAAHVASMAPGLVASTLFGHERGAFTGATAQVRGRFELAHGGTIFLDEIGELSLEDQVRLLRVLQEGSFERVGGSQTLHSDFRLVAATNRDLEAMVSAGRFREDLFYRLNVVPIGVPPLRERSEDIPRLALHFLDRFARQTGSSFEGIGEADVDRLVSYPWPGNVRELEHVIERAVVLSKPPMLKIPELDATRAEPRREARSLQSWVTLEQREREYVADVLLHCSGRITGKAGAAQVLGLKPSTLQSRIDKLDLRDTLEQARGTGKRRNKRR